MIDDKDERKRPQLRLVVNNPERVSRQQAEEPFIPLEELLARREEFRPLFYSGLEALLAGAYGRLERFLAERRWPFAFDPHHGRLVIVPVCTICPETVALGSSPDDEALLFIVEENDGQGLCLSLEVVLPFSDEDHAVMEEDLLYSVPILPYGMVFLEENKHDGLLDMVYRLAIPLYPPAPTGRLLSRFFGIAANELIEVMGRLAE